MLLHFIELFLYRMPWHRLVYTVHHGWITNIPQLARMMFGKVWNRQAVSIFQCHRIVCWLGSWFALKFEGVFCFLQLLPTQTMEKKQLCLASWVHKHIYSNPTGFNAATPVLRRSNQSLRPRGEGRSTERWGERGPGGWVGRCLCALGGW